MPRTLIALLLAASCATHSASPWRQADVGAFSLHLPPDLHKTEARGIDSSVHRWVGPNMEVSSDYGHYSNDFGGWPEDTAFEPVEVDGKAARIGTARHDFGYGFAYSTQIAFRDVRPKIHRSVFAACNSIEDCAVARRIFLSIRFKPE